MIKIDMNMPDRCFICPFYSGYDGGQCLVTSGSMYFGTSEAIMDRHPSCPLEEVDEYEE